MSKIFLNNYTLIFLGCGIGGVLRYLVSNAIGRFVASNFPYGTLTVNATGSFLAGIFFALILEKSTTLNSQLTAFVIIGILGGYTTFSTFSIETLNLLEQGYLLKTLTNIGSNLMLCIFATGLGIVLGRSL